jgi:nucleobase:cation symporter-1, NCS1 family
MVTHLHAGLSISFVAYCAICFVSPPPGLGIGVTRHDDSVAFGERDSAEIRSSSSFDGKEKGLEGSEKVTELPAV